MTNPECLKEIRHFTETVYQNICEYSLDVHVPQGAVDYILDISGIVLIIVLPIWMIVYVVKTIIEIFKN